MMPGILGTMKNTLNAGADEFCLNFAMRAVHPYVLE
jgi:hypothetical protein